MLKTWSGNMLFDIDFQMLYFTISSRSGVLTRKVDCIILFQEVRKFATILEHGSGRNVFSIRFDKDPISILQFAQKFVKCQKINTGKLRLKHL